MIISSREVDLIREASRSGLSGSILTNPNAVADAAAEAQLVMETKQAIRALPDVREELVAAIKARVDAGTYQVAGDEIADVMVRRAYADRIR